jgi:hypothetical protein
MRHFISILFCLFIFSCTKKDKANEPFVGYVEMDSTNTVKTVLVGQNITSRVRLVIPSISGDMTFLGFEIIENPVKTFSVKAKALYKPWAGQVSLPVYQTFDSTISITTSLTGRHILNFYNSTTLLKSDTVQVN